LLDVVAVLEDEGIDYAVIGAMAASLYGPLRGTADADALLWVTQPKLRQLGRVLEKAGFHIELRDGDPDDPIPALLAVTDRYENRIDLLAGLRGVDPEALSRSITVPFRGASLRFIGREDFIAMKCFAGGPQDIQDARGALKGAASGPDVDLLRRITRRFGRDALVVLDQLLPG
jgi:predicted nucleotidyltransferase